MSISLDSLIQRDRKDLADLTLDIPKSDKDTRANKATNQVIMMINRANTVFHPPLYTAGEGVGRVVESIGWMRVFADEFDRLERMSVEDIAYPSIFEQTFNRFFDLARPICPRDVMCGADFELLAPCWQTIRETTHVNILDSLCVESAWSVSPPPRPPSSSPRFSLSPKSKISSPKASKASSGGDNKEKGKAPEKKEDAQTA
ncbi:hypothetical protein BG000_009260 [Podila horticola]|nr:hypothetical protein BG000_009260 [Podila horticola]